LTTMMVLHDFLSKCIATLQDRSRLAWLYTGVNDTTRLECGDRSDLDLEVLALSLLQLRTDLSFDDFTTPPELYAPICLNQAVRLVLLSEMPMLDNIYLVALGGAPTLARTPARGMGRRCRLDLSLDQAPGLCPVTLRFRQRMTSLCRGGRNPHVVPVGPHHQGSRSRRQLWCHSLTRG
jgi:hypothetical protein